MRMLLVTALTAMAVAACAGPSPMPRHRGVPAQSTLTPVQSTLTPAQACQLLLADVTRNSGTVDTTALGHIADRVTAPRMAADARTAVRDIDHTGIAPVALSLLRDDCARAGVHIPAP
jgi:hypothetical protein